MDLVINFRLLLFEFKFSVNKRWIQLAVITFTLLFISVVSYWGSMREMVLMIALLGGIGGFAILSRQPILGIILIFFASMFVPFTGPGGINATVIMIVVSFGMWILDMVVIQKAFYFIRSRVILSVIVFIVVAFISFLMGQIPWYENASQAPFEAQIGGFLIFILSAILFLTVAHLIKQAVWLERIVWIFLGLGGLYMVARFFQTPIHDRIYHWGFTAGSMFWTWMVALALGQAIFNNHLKYWQRGALFGIVIITLFVAYVQANDWKSGWVPPLVVIAALIGLKFPKLTTLAIPIGFIVAIYLAKDLIASDEYSWGTRVDAWLIVLEISKVSPLLGLGFANYYWYTPLFPIRGWRVSFNSHSQLVDIIAQTGVIGFFCFFWILYEVGLLCINLTKRLPEGFGNAYAYSILGGIAGSLMASFLVDWVLPFVYNIGFNGFRASVIPWIFMGGVVSLEQIYNKQANG